MYVCAGRCGNTVVAGRSTESLDRTMDAPDYVSGVMREVIFAVVRCHGETEADRIACVKSVVELAEARGATAEVVGETCVFTYGAVLDAPGSRTAMPALVHELCTSARPASVVHGVRSCVVGLVGGGGRVVLQSRIPGLREIMSELDELPPGEARAV